MLSIIIVNWNTGPRLARCLQSLAELPARERGNINEVVVVDNASRDTSLVQAQVVAGHVAERLRVRFVRLKRNAGFAAAVNAAWQRVAQQPAVLPHLLLLNPDTEVRLGAIDAMLGVLTRRPQAGIIGPKLLYPDGRVQSSVRSWPTLTVFIWLFLKLHRFLPNSGVWRHYLRPDFDYDLEQSAEQVMGAAFLIRDAVAVEVGRLDERFFVWFEEVDYCRRAALAGWEVWYTPRAQVVHAGGVSFGQLVGWRRSWPWLRSSLVYARKHMRPGAHAVLLLLLPLALLLIVPATVYHLITRTA